MSQQFFSFAMVGIIAGLVNVAARAVINFFVPYEIAVVLAFPIALSVAFFLNRNMVFKSYDRQIYSQYFKFLVVNLIALIQVWVVSVGTLRLLFPAIGFTQYPELVSHSLGVASPVLTSYFFYKYWIFKKI